MVTSMATVVCTTDSARSRPAGRLSPQFPRRIRMTGISVPPSLTSIQVKKGRTDLIVALQSNLQECLPDVRTSQSVVQASGAGLPEAAHALGDGAHDAQLLAQGCAH